MSEDLRLAAQRKGALGQTMKAVAWSFFGVRKASAHAEDVARINPVHAIVSGVLFAVGLVLGLLLLIRWILSSGVAQ